MTYGDFIKVLYDTGFFGKNKAKFARTLFSAAHTSDQDASVDSVKTWLYGTRNCDTGKYFNDGKVDEKSFIRYLEQATRDPGSWRILQEAFSSQRASEPEALDFRVDLETNDSGMFYWSLLNQFQRIFHLPESEQEAKDSTIPLKIAPQKEITDKQIHSLFLKAIFDYKIMETINRKPAVLNREDSARLNTFLSLIDVLIPLNGSYKSSLYGSIGDFIRTLQSQVLSLDATLNNRFGFEDDTASVNMEDNENMGEHSKNISRVEIPELSIELFEDADDPAHLLKIAVDEWGNFRNKMNYLYNMISSWQDEP